MKISIERIRRLLFQATSKLEWLESGEKSRIFTKLRDSFRFRCLTARGKARVVHMEKEKKYPALRFISGLYKVLAIVAVILGLLTATIVHGAQSFIGIVGGVIGGISLWAFAE